MSVEKMNPAAYRVALDTPYKGGKRAGSPLTAELGRVIADLCERAQNGDKAALNLIFGQVWPPMSKLFDFVRKEARNDDSRSAK